MTDDVIIHADFGLSVREIRALIRCAEFVEGIFPALDIEQARNACGDKVLPAASGAMKLSVTLLTETADL